MPSSFAGAMGQVTTVNFERKTQNKLRIGTNEKERALPRASVRLKLRRKRTENAMKSPMGTTSVLESVTSTIGHSEPGRINNNISKDCSTLLRPIQNAGHGGGMNLMDFPFDSRNPKDQQIFMHRLGLVPKSPTACPPFLRLHRLPEPTIDQDEKFLLHEIPPRLYDQVPASELKDPAVHKEDQLDLELVIFPGDLPEFWDDISTKKETRLSRQSGPSGSPRAQ